MFTYIHIFGVSDASIGVNAFFMNAIIKVLCAGPGSQRLYMTNQENEITHERLYCWQHWQCDLENVIFFVCEDLESIAELYSNSTFQNINALY